MTVTGVPKRQFRDRLVAVCGGCAIQHNGWPCGSCFQVHFDGDQWRAVLAFRGVVFADRPVAELRRTVRALWAELQRAEARSAEVDATAPTVH